MKILDFIAGPNPRRLRLFLAEKGIEIEFEESDSSSGAARAASYFEPTQTGQYPVLQLDDGSYLSESVAICRYFERLHPKPALFGESPIEEGQVEMWNRRLELGLFRFTADYYGHTVPFFRDRIEQIPAFAKSSQNNAIIQLDMLNRILSDRPFVAGNYFSIADITAFVAIDLGVPTVYEIGTELKDLKRWYAVTASRPSFRTVFSK